MSKFMRPPPSKWASAGESLTSRLRLGTQSRELLLQRLDLLLRVADARIVREQLDELLVAGDRAVQVAHGAGRLRVLDQRARVRRVGLDDLRVDRLLALQRRLPQ